MACGCRRASRPTTTRPRSTRSSTAWPSATSRSSVFHFDCFWMREFHWTDFEWDPAVFPDPEGMLARLHERGLRVSAWLNPYLAQRSRLFREGAERGYLVRRPDGSRVAVGLLAGGHGARRLHESRCDALVPGARSSAARPGRRRDQDGLRRANADRRRVARRQRPRGDASPLHRTSTTGPCSTCSRRCAGQGEAVLFARSATAGGQQLPVHWGGDNSSSFTSMAESLRGGLSLASQRLRLLEPRHRRLRGRPRPRGVQALARVRPALEPFAPARLDELPGAVGVRRRHRGAGQSAVEVARRFAKLKRVAAAVPRRGRRGGAQHRACR